MTNRARQYARRCREHFDELVPAEKAAPPPPDAAAEPEPEPTPAAPKAE
jgi:hypothetical protein